MGTLVCLHAHPDDECISTGGTIARAAAEGHRVVLVVATNGDHGEVPADLAAGETLVERRRKETLASAATLGVHRVEWLGYEDSGMTGWAQNANSGAFMNADLDEAATRLATILREEDADVFTCYDWHGGYGHPDHVMVHKVGHRAAEIVGTVKLYEATMNRDRMRALISMAREMGMIPEGEDDFDPDGPADDGHPMGSTEQEITIGVDIQKYAPLKRKAMSCHASQLSDSGFFLAMDEERFTMAFGHEWFIDPAVGGPVRDGWLFS